jgi:hypothetical protein
VVINVRTRLDELIGLLEQSRLKAGCVPCGERQRVMAQADAAAVQAVQVALAPLLALGASLLASLGIGGKVSLAQASGASTVSLSATEAARVNSLLAAQGAPSLTAQGLSFAGVGDMGMGMAQGLSFAKAVSAEDDFEWLVSNAWANARDYDNWDPCGWLRKEIEADGAYIRKNAHVDSWRHSDLAAEIEAYNRFCLRPGKIPT